MKRWLLKTEPQEYSFSDLEWEGRGTWDGVKNPQALAFLAKVRPGDEAFIYHTGKDKAIVGIARVTSKPYQGTDAAQLVVDLAPHRRLPHPVTLSEIKALPEFSTWELVRLPRLSVMPVPREYWDRVLKLSAAEKRTPGPESLGEVRGKVRL